MARELNLTTQKQEFIKESYLKEMHTRINWWRHYRKNLQPAPRLKPEANVRDDIKLPTITGPSIQAKVDNKNGLNIHSVQNLRDGKWSDQIETSPTESEMKPVSPGTRSLLYHGTSKEGKGRYHYLKIRNSFGPDEKYCYPIATSWIYGWHFAGNLIDNSCPQYRRCRIVSDTFYRKNGILAQPNHTDMAL
ncbi:protein ATP6V1FNB isoform X1 [Bufo bufo]|uniref:protein ATP6V1FNB isoform X1 n=1 Tax=Bufo bufo TaxID=8384 RepID=UPI001ABEA290|nr:protein ATP6V1FNB isoform X1 [Bufo bufo]